MKMCWVSWHIITQRVIHCCTFCDSCMRHKEIALRSFSSTSISGIRSRIKRGQKKKKGPFSYRMSPLLFTSARRRKGGAWKWILMTNSSQWRWDSLLASQGRSFPSWCGPENKWERPPRCCSARWARDAMIMYSPGVGSAFEKCWCWEKMALRCLKGEPRGGQMLWYSSRGLAAGPRGCSLPSRGTVLLSHAHAAQREKPGNGRQCALACSSGHVAAFTRRGQKGKIWSQTVLICKSVREWVSRSAVCCVKAKLFWLLTLAKQHSYQFYEIAGPSTWKRRSENLNVSESSSRTGESLMAYKSNVINILNNPYYR